MVPFIHEHGFSWNVNNSYSGSTVCHTGYEKADYSDRSFITRIHNLGTPDIILVFGGTNDSWAGAPIGVYQYDAGRKPICIASVLPFAICLHLSSSSILRPGFIILPLNPQLHSRSATYIKRNGLLIRKITIKSSSSVLNSIAYHSYPQARN